MLQASIIIFSARSCISGTVCCSTPSLIVVHHVLLFKQVWLRFGVPVWIAGQVVPGLHILLCCGPIVLISASDIFILTIFPCASGSLGGEATTTAGTAAADTTMDTTTATTTTAATTTTTSEPILLSSTWGFASVLLCTDCFPLPHLRLHLRCHHYCCVLWRCMRVGLVSTRDQIIVI